MIFLRKYKQVMRIMFFLLFVTINICSATNTYAQFKMISLNVKEVSIQEVFSEIEKNSEFIFFYKNVDIDPEWKVSVKVKNQTISQILSQLFDKTD